MSHSFSKNHQHIIFSTSGRQKLIRKDLQPKLWAYVAGICRNHEMFVHAIGGVEDHLHLLVEIPPKMPVARAVVVVKSNSSRWMGELGNKFAWQKGYGAFSVSASNVPRVVRYIENQERHHRKQSFEQEFISFLKRHQVQYHPATIFE